MPDEPPATPPDDGDSDPELLMLWVVGATAIVTLVAAGLIDTAGKAVAGAVAFAVVSAVACFPWPAKRGESSTPDRQESGQRVEPPAPVVAPGRHLPPWGSDSTLADGMADGHTCALVSGHDGRHVVRPGSTPGPAAPSEPDGAAGVGAAERLPLQSGK